MFIFLFFLSAHKGGDIVSANEAGLPNITGMFRGVYRGNSTSNGCFSLNGGITSGTGYYDGGGGDNYNVNFDASKSNEIYGKSDKVLPESFSLIAQIKY